MLKKLTLLTAFLTFILTCLLMTPMALTASSIASGTEAILTGPTNYHYLKDNTRVFSSTSYDRDGGNGDAGSYLYYRNGEKVLMEAKGPGAVYKIFMPSMGNNAYLKFYFDGETSPRIHEKVVDIFKGKSPYFKAPLASTDSPAYEGIVPENGYVLYVPIPFAESLRITSNAPGFFLIDYAVYAPGTEVTTWTPSQDNTGVIDMFNKTGKDPKDSSKNTVVAGSIDLPANGTETVTEINTPSQTISSIKLKVPGIVNYDYNSATISDTGRAFTGYSQFDAALESTNQGVKLVRRLDWSSGDQKANVYVDGALVGQWMTPANSSPEQTWLDSTFYIPASFTVGKTKVTIKVENAGGQSDWNEYKYTVYSIDYKDYGDCLVESDSINIGNPVSENSHNYVINTETWSGSQTLTYTTLASNLTELLNNITMKVFFDNETEPSIDAPIGDLFGFGHFGLDPNAPKYRTRSLMVGLDETNNLYIYFPMPFAQKAEIRLENKLDTVINGVDYEVQHQDFTGSMDDVGYFKAKYGVAEHFEYDDQEINYLNVEGSGTLVGIIASMTSDRPTNKSNYLEGDEHIFIDGNLSPHISGTGTEDLYNGAYYWVNGTVSMPLFGCPYNGKWSEGGILHIEPTYKSVAYRFFLGEAMPFKKSIVFNKEHGGGYQDEPNNAYEKDWFVVYYYHKEEPTMGQLDFVDVGNSSSETSHNYTATSQTATTLTSKIEGRYHTPAKSDSGKKISRNGYSQFDLAIIPNNKGMILRRLFNYSIVNQDASVYVDGQFVGTWYDPGINTKMRFKESEFRIPESFTAGKDSITVKILVKSDYWTEFNYSALVCFEPGTPIPPAVPTDLKAITTSSSAITISWSNVSDANAYDLEIDGATVENATSPYLHENLAPNTTHTYRIRSKNDESRSSWSSEITASTYSTGNVIFSDNFNDGNLDSWTLTNGTWTNEGTVAQGESYPDSFMIKDITASDFIYEADVKLVTDTGAGIITFRGQDASGGKTYAIALDTNSNYVKFYKFPYVSIATYDFNFESNRWYHIKVVARDNQFQIYFDNNPTPVIDATDDSYSTGNFGLASWRGTFQFDNVKATFITTTPPPVNTINLLAGKTPTTSVPYKDIDVITDGDKQALYKHYAADGNVASGPVYIQFDLNQPRSLTKVNIWHFAGDIRTYHDVIVQLSNDPTFQTGVTTVFNNDQDNSSNLGLGTDAPYVESNDGKTITFSPVTARYIRLWSKGNTVNNANHYVEVEAY